MGFIDYKIKKTFGKIFNGVAKELGAEVKDVKIGIVYKDGQCFYEAYRGNEKEKDIKLDDYLNILDSGTHMIDATIGQAGTRYAKELTEKLEKEVVPNDISIILKDNPDKIPLAALMAFGTRQRMIDIKTEFTQDQ